MKSKLTILAVVIAAGILGFWYGRHRTVRYYQDVVLKRTIHNSFLDETRKRAQLNLNLLMEFHDGAQPQIQETLERQLSVAAGALGAEWRNTPPQETYGNDLFLIRDIRNYRSQHPRTNDPPELADRIQTAFRLTDQLPK